MGAIVIVLNSLFKSLNTDEGRLVKGYIYALLFPTIVLIGMASSSGLYLITTVQDR